MTLLYQPSSSGHWQHTGADDERDSTYEAVSDLLGVRLPVKPDQIPAEKPVMSVQLQGQQFRVPDPCSKQFYRELTYLSDEEMIEKYGLVLCTPEDYRRKTRRFSTESKSSAGSSVRSG
ncbi:hypothetical protein Slin15195_G083700 [Septoria linicola]|uniref:Uncharacterized protein n=1 Tax=Septoria linicola TaxID=215465 RepID=A0A9Q9EKQ6_9PEZI|nr:hypothetical protein Slin14017_G086210 [Septoria linicola]USW55051.1 hypothetical protein Slin15195_G083700 [Septoria linicola]